MTCYLTSKQDTKKWLFLGLFFYVLGPCRLGMVVSSLVDPHEVDSLNTELSFR